MPHAARQNRRVRSRAADVGDEGREVLILERHHVGRRKIVGDDNQRLALAALGCLERRLVAATDQLTDDAFDNLPHVVATLTQVDIVDLLELIDQDLHLLDDGPLGVANAVRG